MKWQNIEEKPISIHGLAIKENGVYFRLPMDVIDTVSPGVSQMARNTASARVRFRTDSKSLEIRYRPLNQGVDGFAISRAGKSMIAVYINGCFDGVTIKGHSEKTTFRYESKHGLLDRDINDVVIYMPIDNGLEFMEIGIDDDARIMAPSGYTYEKPIVFYGSSITQGLAASHPGRPYVDQVCRKLDTEYYNLGFSGNCKAEKSISDYIAKQDMSVFVYDYDHNAPSAEYLRETHEALFLNFREKNPDTPVVFISRPDFYKNLPDDHERRNIVRATYENALARGDKNVTFIDGESLFGYEADRYECTVDGVHPNDLGFERMSAVIYPVLKEILKKR